MTAPSLATALSLLGKNDKDKTTTNLMPTAKARKVLEKLVNGSPDDFKDIPLRPLVQDLFNWDGKNHTNKPLIRTFDEVIQNRGTYPQAVEMLGFLSAASPLLEADQIARILEKAKTTQTAFAPTLYTINFSQRLQTGFAYLSSERRERILASLWDIAHDGRWWATPTIAVDNNNMDQQENVSADEIIKMFKDYVQSVDANHPENESLQILDDALWSRTSQKAFAEKIAKELVKEIAIVSEDFRKKLIQGHTINPDIAIYLSSVRWLAPNQRPESPISGLVKIMNAFYEDESLDLTKIKKPNSFSDYFTNNNIDLNGLAAIDYTFDPNVIHYMEGKPLKKDVKLSLITNKARLSENAKHMGNCTATYEKNMNDGVYALFYAKDGSQEYNLAISLSGNTWKLREVKGRYNSKAPDTIVAEFERLIAGIPKVSDDYKSYIKNSDKTAKSHLIYKYSID